MKKQYKLSDFTIFVNTKAINFAKREADIEDFKQEGMLAAWQALQDDPFATKSYVQQRIKWRMLDHLRRRIYKNPEELSANETFGNILYSDYNLEDD